MIRLHSGVRGLSATEFLWLDLGCYAGRKEKEDWHQFSLKSTNGAAQEPD